MPHHIQTPYQQICVVTHKSSLQMPYDTHHSSDSVEEREKYYQYRRLLFKRIFYFLHLAPLESPERMVKPFTKDTNQTWCSEAADATTKSCGIIKMLCLVLPDIHRKRDRQKHLSWELLHHYLRGDRDEGKSFFGFFEAYLFQWLCYQKG